MAATTPLDPAQQADRPRWGFTDEELASRPHAFRDDLLAGQVCLVSGGGSGLGRAMAFLYARLGAKVMICARTMPVCRSTRNQQATEPKNERKAVTNHSMTGRLIFGMSRMVQLLVDEVTPAEHVDSADVLLGPLSSGSAWRSCVDALPR